MQKEILKAFVKCYELGVDRDRYEGDMNSVVKPSQDVPDEIVE